MPVTARKHLVELTVAGLCFGLVLLFRFFLPADWVFDITAHPIGRDFLNVWGAPRVAAQHGAVVLADLQQYPVYLSEAFGHPLKRFFNWSYPPHALLLLWPVSLPPYPVALALWTASGLGLFAWAVASGLDKHARTVGATVAVLAPASIWCVLTGQNGLIFGAAMLAALQCLDRRPILAGVLFGLLTVKPQLGLLVPIALVAMGAWRTIATAAVTAIALGLVSLAVLGPEPWRLWLTVTSAYQVALIEDITNFHRYMMMSIAASGFIVDAPKTLIWALQGLGAMLAAASVWIGFRRSHDPATRSLILLLSAALLTPYVFNYDMIALTGAVIWRIAARPPESAPERSVFGLVFLLPVAIVPLHMINLPIAPLVILAALVITIRPLLGWRRSEAEAGVPAAAL